MKDMRAWVERHKVCWEFGPLREYVMGHGLEVTGYELTLFGRFDPTLYDDDDAAAREVYEGLHELAEELLRSIPEPHSIVRVLPYDRAVHLRPEAGYAVEVELTIVASPPHPDQPIPAAEVQAGLATVAARLREMGLREKSWDRLG
jgi:hypothetical protein